MKYKKLFLLLSMIFTIIPAVISTAESSIIFSYKLTIEKLCVLIMLITYTLIAFPLITLATYGKYQYYVDNKLSIKYLISIVLYFLMSTTLEIAIYRYTYYVSTVVYCVLFSIFLLIIILELVDKNISIEWLKTYINNNKKNITICFYVYIVLELLILSFVFDTAHVHYQRTIANCYADKDPSDDIYMMKFAIEYMLITICLGLSYWYEIFKNKSRSLCLFDLIIIEYVFVQAFSLFLYGVTNVRMIQNTILIVIAINYIIAELLWIINIRLLKKDPTI